jgi:hypothetical protein
MIEAVVANGQRQRERQQLHPLEKVEWESGNSHKKLTKT